MGKETQDRLSLFATGLIQVLLVGLNTWQISHDKYIGAFIVGFLISFVWTWNVKKIAFGSTSDRFIYAFGAAVGTISGLMIAKLIYL